MPDLKQEFERALLAARQNDSASARNILKGIIEQDPGHLDAWLLLAHVAERREHAIACYQRALQIAPGHAYARQKLDELQAASPPPAPSPAAPAPSPVARTPVQAAPEPPRPVVSASLPANHDVLRTVPPPPQPGKPKRSTLEVVLLSTLVTLVICAFCFGLGYLLRGPLAQLPFFRPTPSNEEIFAVIYENADATNAEDIDRYMATIHPDSPLYDDTLELLNQAFSTYDLLAEVSGLEIVSRTASEVRVACTVTTRRINGPAFQNNRIQAVMILRPDNGVWKIYDQTVENVEYLP